jgi:hypothetical protein
MSSSTRRFHGLLFLIWLVSATGCSQFDMKRRIPWRPDTDDNPGQVSKILATWTDAVSHKQGQPPKRGFGGRLMFFEADSDKPVKIEGDLVVYAFDEEGRKPTNTKPDRKYVFPAATLERHYSESKIGHSYSVWLPWGEVGGPQKEIGLVARLVPKEGAAVVSPQSKIVLPGKKSPTTDQYTAPADQYTGSGDNRGEIQPVAYSQTVGTAAGNGPGYNTTVQYGGQNLMNSGIQAAAYAGAPPVNRMKTTTINIQPNFGHRTPVAATRSRPNRIPQAGTSAVEPPTSAPAESGRQPRSTRYSPSRSRPLGEPIARLSRDRGPTPRRPAGWRSPFQSQPESGNSTAAD